MVALNGALFLLVCAAALATAAGDGESLKCYLYSLMFFFFMFSQIFLIGRSSGCCEMQ
jgi:uncharacterized membrane protein